MRAAAKTQSSFLLEVLREAERSFLPTLVVDFFESKFFSFEMLNTLVESTGGRERSSARYGVFFQNCF